MRALLKGKRIAILVADGFEQIELTSPREALRGAGAVCEIVSPAANEVQGWHHDRPGEMFPVDVALPLADANDYDALLLPGGVQNPDTLRMSDDAVRFVRAFVEAGKPMAAICHGPWTLIEAGMTYGRTLTSWPSLKSDLLNAGANWVDREVVVDNGLVTSRRPDDLPAFNAAMIDEFAREPELAQAILRMSPDQELLER